MTDRFIPPPPSAEAFRAAMRVSSHPVDLGALAAANAIDQPRVCREEVEKFAEFVLKWVPSAYADYRVRMALADFVTRYNRASDGPAPEPVQTPPGIVDVVALHRGANAPHLCDRPETLAFLRAQAAVLAAVSKLPNNLSYSPSAMMALQQSQADERDAARAFLAATDPEAK